MRSCPFLFGPTAEGETNAPVLDTRVVRSGEHEIRVCTGGPRGDHRGLPTVVFENGLGSRIEDWGSLPQRAAEITSVVAYDRPGIGGSAHATFSPTSENIAALLHSVLELTGVTKPYVLVGFSLGGVYVRMYAALYREEVAGILYIDPVDFTETREDALAVFSEIGSGRAGLDEYDEALDLFMRESRNRPALSEWNEVRKLILDSFSSYERLPTIRHIPQVLIASTKEQPPFAKLTFDFAAWSRLSRRHRLDRLVAWVSSIDEGHLVTTPSSAHKIHDSDPGLVLWAIRRLVYPDLSKRLRALIEGNSEAAFIAAYNKLKANYPPENLGEDLLNSLGYEMLQQGKLPEALAAFRLNVDEYPRAANPYDSLGEAYTISGEFALSAANYRRSLELDPANKNAENRLRELNRKLLAQP